MALVQNDLTEIKKLAKFVEFVEGLEYTSATNKVKATEVISLINNMGDQETYRQWYVSLDIYDPDLLVSSKKKGIYRRNWHISFENDVLEIVAESKHTEFLNHIGGDFFFYGEAFFDREGKTVRVNMNKTTDEFINDAGDYKKYLTEILNEIEVDIDIW